ncbi:MAG: caspase family protein [Crocinitomicaceae bacterium]|nr:caspase family protein [Crocinitomicaceae bacterium]
MNRFLLSLLLIFVGSTIFGQSNPKLETILQQGHAKYVTAADFHPSGKYVATGGYDNAIILWNLSNGKQIRMFNRHTAPVWSVEFSPEGDQLLSTSADKTINLYDIKTGELIHSWESGNEDVRQAYFSGNGQYIYYLNNRDEYHVCDRKTGKLLGDYKKNYSAYYLRNLIDPSGTRVLNTSGYKGAEVLELGTGDTILQIPFDKVWGMAFSPDGSKIALSSSKLFAKIFDAQTGKELADLTDPDSDERCDGCNTKMTWSNDGKYLMTMSNKVDAILWDAATGKKIKAFNDVRERPTILKFSPDDSHIVMSLGDQLFAYQTKTGKKTLEIKKEGLDYFDINFDPLSNKIILPGKNSTAEIWDVSTGKRVDVLEGYLNKDRDDGLRFSYDSYWDSGILKYLSLRRSFAISPDDKYMVIGGIDSTALMIELSTGKVIQEFKGHSKVVIAFDFSPDGKTLATAGGDRHLKLWDVKTGKLISDIGKHRELIFDLSFDNSGEKIVTASWDGTMCVWDLKNEKYHFKDMGGNSPYCVGFTPNDLYVVSGNLKNNFKFYEADVLEEFRDLVGNDDIVSDFAFSSNGSKLVTCSWDGNIKVWDVISGMLIGKHHLHNGPVYSCDWSNDGKYVVSSGADGIIHLWDPEKRSLVKSLKGHTSAVTKVRFTSDSKKVISISVDGEVKVWNIDQDKPIYSRIQISRNEWLTTTPSGYFDGSSKALNVVNYVSGMEVVPVGSLFDKYYTPGLIKRIYAGEKFEDTGENIKELIESSPLIAFHLTESSKRSIPVEHDSVYKWKKNVLPLGIQINSKDHELQEIRVYNNGKLVIAESLQEELVFRGGEKDIRNYEVPLADGENEITGLVINKDRTESVPTKILVHFDGEAAQTDLYILSIGINEYKNPKYNLDYAVNDSKSFTKSIKDGGAGLFTNVFEYSITNEKATKEVITATIKEIEEKIGPEDVFLFYYAGHGVMSFEKDETQSDFYIVTHDVTNLYGEVDMLKEKAISAKELMAFSIEISAEKQLFILDACHSGGALESFATRGDGREKALAQLARSTGTFFLTASQDAQYANEVGNLKHGLFTYALLEILDGQMGDNGDHKITINEIKSYVEDRVPELSEEYRGSPQYPTSYSFGQDFPIVIIK